MIEIIKFEKKCPHGKPMRLVQKFGGSWWYESENCSDCKVVADEQEQKQLDYFF